jgi:hypothetical protein
MDVALAGERKKGVFTVHWQIKVTHKIAVGVNPGAFTKGTVVGSTKIIY